MNIFIRCTGVRRNTICIKANGVSQTPSVWANILSQKLRLSTLLSLFLSLFGKITMQIRLGTFQPWLCLIHNAHSRASYSCLSLNKLCTSAVTLKCGDDYLRWHRNAYMHKSKHVCAHKHCTHTHTQKDTKTQMATAQGLFLTHEHTLAVSPNIQTWTLSPHSHLGFISGTCEREIIKQ